MEITEVRISPSKGGKVRAFVGIVIDDCFIVNDLRVMEGREGQLFVTMPARKTRNGQMRDVANPLNSETRRIIEEKVLAEYTEATANLGLPSVPERGESSRRREKQSILDRVVSRLFVEEFWLPENERNPTGGDHR
ncbi:MAG: SpoVG family protein [Thermoanaerobaculales bacterium]|nr:SpoVG family protein [Thermoanaerobaculales bacterium]